MALELEGLAYEVWCDYPDCIDGLETYHENVTAAVEIAESAGWVHRDGHWYCPEHAEKGGEAK